MRENRIESLIEESMREELELMEMWEEQMQLEQLQMDIEDMWE